MGSRKGGKDGDGGGGEHRELHTVKKRMLVVTVRKKFSAWYWR
jgi:hypothetical protein